MRQAIATVLFGLILAAIIHIGTLLFAPQLSLSNAWDTMVDPLEPFVAYPVRARSLAEYDPRGAGETAPTLPDILPDPNFPALREIDPAFQNAVCRFDLRTGPVHLRTVGVDGFWTANVFTFGGISYYSTTEQINGGKPLNVLVTTPQQVASLRLNNSASLSLMTIVETDIEDGALLLRAYQPYDEALPADLEALREKVYCEPFREGVLQIEATPDEATDQDPQSDDDFTPVTEE